MAPDKSSMTLGSILEISAELNSITDYIRWCTSVLRQSDVYFGHGSDNAFDEARALVLSALHLPFEIPDYYLSSRITEAEQLQIRQWLQQRVVEKKPLAYLTNEILFAGLSFYVDERVLIPRSPIAELIDSRFSPWWSEEKPISAILDMCTGSGCIGIAAGLEMDALVTLADISEEALAVAAINAEYYQEAIDITLVQSDLFENISDKYDLILTNPPYVDQSEIAEMAREYHHEPMLGLASGDDGLFHIEKILRQAVNYLTDDGLLFAEVGASQYALEQKYPELPLMWLDFENGGSGIFVIDKANLLQWQQSKVD
jgi:ribosomal protein L3 glutamine methyltransferase